MEKKVNSLNYVRQLACLPTPLGTESIEKEFCVLKYGCMLEWSNFFSFSCPKVCDRCGEPGVSKSIYCSVSFSSTGFN